MVKTKELIITDKLFYRKMVTLIIPFVLQQLINQGVNMMDTVMVGRLGEIAISATSLANQFYSIYHFLILGLSAAGGVLCSQYWGAGDEKTVSDVFDMLVQLATAASLFFALLSCYIPERIMRIYTADAAIVSAGAAYLGIMALVYFFHGVSLLLANLIRSSGNTSLGLYAACISFVVNIGANYVFIFGHLGFPAMGVKGAALGTLLARVVEFIVTVVYLLHFEKRLKYRFTGVLRLPGRFLFSEFKRLGLPATVSDTLLALATSAIGMILGRIGKEYVSAYAIVAVVDKMCNIAGMSLAMSAGIIVGQTVGAGDYPLAKKQGRTFLLISVLFGLIVSGIVWLAGTWTIGFYDITAETAEIARQMMAACALLFVFQCISCALGKGVLRGGGDTGFLMVFDVVFQWITSIPLGYILGIKLGAAPFIMFMAIKSDTVLRSIVFTWRLRSGNWIQRVKKEKLHKDTR